MVAHDHATLAQDRFFRGFGLVAIEERLVESSVCRQVGNAHAWGANRFTAELYPNPPHLQPLTRCYDRAFFLFSFCSVALRKERHGRLSGGNFSTRFRFGHASHQWRHSSSSGNRSGTPRLKTSTENPEGGGRFLSVLGEHVRQADGDDEAIGWHRGRCAALAIIFDPPLLSPPPPEETAAIAIVTASPAEEVLLQKTRSARSWSMICPRLLNPRVEPRRWSKMESTSRSSS